MKEGEPWLGNRARGDRRALAGGDDGDAEALGDAAQAVVDVVYVESEPLTIQLPRAKSRARA